MIKSALLANLPYLAAIGVAGAFVLMRVAVRPTSYWAWLSVGCLATAGLSVGGYPFADEVVALGVLIGLFMAMSVRAVQYRTHPWGLGDVAFAGLVFVFFLGAVRSVIAFGSPAMLRFVILYVLVGLVALARRRVALPSCSGPALRRLAAVSVTAYLLAYLAFGIYTEMFTGASRFDPQGLNWSGSAYAMFPAIVGVFAAVIILRYAERRSYGWALTTLVSTALTASYYESRVTLLGVSVVAFAAIVGSARGGTRRRGALRRQRVLVVAGALVFVGVVLNSYGASGEISGSQFSRVSAAVLAPFQGGSGRDTDRWNHLEAALRALDDSPSVALVGDGVYSHRIHLVEPLNEVLAESGQPAVTADIVRTTGFPALIIDAGLMGVACFGLSLGFAARAASRSARREARPAIWAMALVIGGWLLVSNILDMVLLYLLIMPRGLLPALSEPGLSPGVLTAKAPSGSRQPLTS